MNIRHGVEENQYVVSLYEPHPIFKYYPAAIHNENAYCIPFSTELSQDTNCKYILKNTNAFSDIALSNDTDWEQNVKNRFLQVENRIALIEDTLDERELDNLRFLSVKINSFCEKYVKQKVHQLDEFIWNPKMKEESKEGVKKELDAIYNHELSFCNDNKLIFPWSDTSFFSKEHQVAHALIRSLCHLHPENIRKLINYFVFEFNFHNISDEKVEDFWKSKENFLKQLVNHEVQNFTIFMNDWDIRFQKYIITHPIILRNICIGLGFLHTTCCLIPFTNEWRSQTAFYEQKEGPFYQFLYANQKVSILKDGKLQNISLVSNSNNTLEELCKLDDTDLHFLAVRQYDQSHSEFENKKYIFEENKDTEKTELFKNNVLKQIDKKKQLLSCDFWKGILLKTDRGVDTRRSLYVEIDPDYTALDEPSYIWLHTFFVNEILVITEGKMPFRGLELIISENTDKKQISNFSTTKLGLLNNLVLQNNLQFTDFLTNLIDDSDERNHKNIQISHNIPSTISLDTSGFFNLDLKNNGDQKIYIHIVQSIMPNISDFRTRGLIRRNVRRFQKYGLAFMYNMLIEVSNFMNNSLFYLDKILQDIDFIEIKKKFNFKTNFCKGDYVTWLYLICDSCKWAIANIQYILKIFATLMVLYNSNSILAKQSEFDLFKEFSLFVVNKLENSEEKNEMEQEIDFSELKIFEDFKKQYTIKNKSAVRDQSDFVKDEENFFWIKHKKQSNKQREALTQIQNYKFNDSFAVIQYVNLNEILDIWDFFCRGEEFWEKTCRGPFRILKDVCQEPVESKRFEIMSRITKQYLQEEKSKLAKFKEDERKYIVNEKLLKEEKIKLEEENIRREEEERKEKNRREKEEKKERIRRKEEEKKERIRREEEKKEEGDDNDLLVLSQYKKIAKGIDMARKVVENKYMVIQEDSSLKQQIADATITKYSLDQIEHMFQKTIDDDYQLPDFFTKQNEFMSSEQQRHLIREILQNQEKYIQGVDQPVYGWNEEAEKLWTIDEDLFQKNIQSEAEQAIIMHKLLGSGSEGDQQIKGLEDLTKSVLKTYLKINPVWDDNSTKKLSSALIKKTVLLASIIDEAKQFTQITETQLQSVLKSFQIHHLFEFTESNNEIYAKLLQKVQNPALYGNDIASWLENTDNFDRVSQFWEKIFENKKSFDKSFNMNVAVNRILKSTNSANRERARNEAFSYLDQLEKNAEPVPLNIPKDEFKYAKWENLPRFPKRDSAEGKDLYETGNPEKFQNALIKYDYIDPNSRKIHGYLVKWLRELQDEQHINAQERRRAQISIEKLTVNFSNSLIQSNRSQTQKSNIESNNDSPELVKSSRDKSDKEKSVQSNSLSNVNQTENVIPFKPTTLQHFPFRCPYCPSTGFQNFDECTDHVTKHAGDKNHYELFNKLKKYVNLTEKANARCNGNSFWIVKDWCEMITQQIRSKGGVLDHEDYEEVEQKYHSAIKYKYIPLDESLPCPIMYENDSFYNYKFHFYDYFENAMNYIFGFKQGPAFKSVTTFNHDEHENMNERYKIQLFETPAQSAARIAKRGYDVYEPGATEMVRKANRAKNKVRADRNNDRGDRRRDKQSRAHDQYDEEAGRRDADKEKLDLDEHNENYKKSGIRLRGRWYSAS